MKAVCLLLCLALARDSAGNLFRRQRLRPQQMEELIVTPLDYLNMDQALYQQQKQHTQQQQQQYQQRMEQQYLEKQLKQYKQEREELYPQQQQNQPQPRTSEEYTHQHQMSQRNQQRQQKAYKLQYNRQSSESNSKESNSKESNSKESNSQETKNIIEKFTAPQYADVKNLIGNRNQEIMPMHGDAITWKGVKIAVSPNSRVSKQDMEKIFYDAYKTINRSNKDNKKISHEALEAAVEIQNEDAQLNATDLLNKYQYPVEEHMVKTDDGYYLTLFRIPPRDQQTSSKMPVVFLMHGLLGSADDWLLMGPGKSLAYLLADAGYDVWLGNARGNKYSRQHASKHSAQSDFWQFSIDEIALHDLPAMIDHALKMSNQEKLYYVGHSQGTTVYFALAATRPEYNDKIITMYALSPMAYMSNTRSPMLRMIAPTSNFYERLHEQLGHGQFKANKEFVHTVGGEMCQNEIGCKHVCSNVNFVMSGVNVDNMDVETIPVILGHLPAGASTRLIKQYAQGVASHEFTKYDFGAEVNEKVYGSPQPPKYDMKKVQTPVVLFYSEEDWLAHPKDVRRLEKELGNVKDAHKVPVEHFTNMDFQFSKEAPRGVYKKLIDSIQKEQKQQKQQKYVY